MVCAAERSWDLKYRRIIKAMMMRKRVMEESTTNFANDEKDSSKSLMKLIKVFFTFLIFFLTWSKRKKEKFLHHLLIQCFNPIVNLFHLSNLYKK